MERTKECFKIRIATCDTDVFDMNGSETLKKITNCLGYKLKLFPIQIEADPFLFVHDDRLYLFYEQMNYLHKGVIMMTCSADLKTWSKPRMVLKENFHLSYPFVFEDGGAIYMLPETNQASSVRLYKAKDNDLTNFVFHKELVGGVDTEEAKPFVDSCIYKKDNHYYLFTSYMNKGVYQMDLYIATDLLGEYKLHPCSPVCNTNKIGRNGGCLFNWNGKLYRPSQDCTHSYGENIQISEILDLSPQNYEEKMVIDGLFPKSMDFYKEGGHQFNLVRYKEKYIIATDAREYAPFLTTDLLFPIRYAGYLWRKYRK